MASRSPYSRTSKSSEKSTTHPQFGSKLILIEGAIGVGKTSLTRLLADRWNCRSFFEVFEENPFLTGGFYEKPGSHAFNTETFFLLSRFRQQQELLKSPELTVSDYMFEKSAIFASLNLQGKDLDIYQSVYEKFASEVRTPDLIVFLQADLETLLRRIYFRDRRFERSLSPAYLEKLMNEYYRFFTSYTKAPVLTIPTSGMDFVSETEDFRKIAALIEERLSGKVQLSLRTQGRSRKRAASSEKSPERSV